MAKQNWTITVIGNSGKSYKMNTYDLNTSFNAVGGIYIFIHLYKKDGKYQYEHIYCGKTENLSTRFNKHHKALEIKNHKANYICILPLSNEKERTNVEKDILDGNIFPCNDINN
jgi:hypothetical protein